MKSNLPKGTFYLDKPCLIYIKDRKLLMVREQHKEIFYFLGGKRDGNETDIECMKRELKEELNVDIIESSLKDFFVLEAQAGDKSKPTVIKYTFYFGEISGEPIPSSEIAEMRYFSVDDYKLTDSSGALVLNRLKEMDLID